MYAKIENGNIIKYPISLFELKKNFPNINFGTFISDELLNNLNIVVVYDSIKPSYNENTQKIVETAPELIEGQWTQQWSVIGLTEQELEDRIPKVVSSLQGMLAIKAAGLVPGFLAWKSTLDPIDDFETISFLEKAQTWIYDDPVLNSALVILGIENQKAALFTLAATL